MKHEAYSSAGHATLVTPACANPVLDATTQMFVDSLMAASGAPLHTLPYAKARDALTGLQSGPVAKRPVVMDDLVLPIGPTGEVDIRIVRPRGVSEALPAVIYLHGGGWVRGDKNTHDRLVREIAVGARAAVVFVDYTLAPEARYPVQNEQAYAVLRYVADHAASLGLDGSRLAVAGDGSGGMMAATLALLAKKRKGPDIALQVLFTPMIMADGCGGSFKTFETGPWLTAAAVDYYLDAAFPLPSSRKEAEAFPINATATQLEGLPSAVVITAEADMLRDQGEVYARKLMQAGVTVAATRYNGTIHDFVMLNALAETPAARAAVAQACAALRDAFTVEIAAEVATPAFV